MPAWKLAVNAAFFGPNRTRYTVFGTDRSLEERLALVAQVPGLDGVELKFPGDFADAACTAALLDKYGLTLSAVNVETKDAQHWRHGALSAADPAARGYCIERLCAGMDTAAEFGAAICTTCPLADAYDYPFQIDYAAAWERFIDTARQAAAHRSDVRFCLEYQPHEPHAHVLLENVGKMLHVAGEVNLPNFGANLDIGHAIAAGESPAESAALLAAKQRLFYLHSDDNTADGGDWDMISGSVHLWHWLELLMVLDRVGYDGYISADISAKHFGPVEAFAANVRMIRRMQAFLERVGPDRLADLAAADGNVPQVFEFLSARLLGEE
jgi:xylose isomerase